MASGILGQAALSTSTNTTVYTVPASTLAVVNINIVNRSTSSTAEVRVALATTAGSPTNAEYIEFDAVIPVRGVLERTGIALQATENIVVFASTANCSVSVYGLEQAV
jgi:hypothetical protein